MLREVYRKWAYEADDDDDADAFALAMFGVECLIDPKTKKAQEFAERAEEHPARKGEE
jgi:hypothetical protein